MSRVFVTTRRLLCLRLGAWCFSQIPPTLPEGSAWHARRWRRGQRAVPVLSPPACTQATQLKREGSTFLTRSCAARSRASSWRKTLHALLSSAAVPSSMPCAHLASWILSRASHTQGTRNGNPCVKCHRAQDRFRHLHGLGPRIPAKTRCKHGANWVATHNRSTRTSFK